MKNEITKLLDTPFTLTPEQEQQLIPGKSIASVLPPRELVSVGWICAMSFLRKNLEEIVQPNQD